MTLQLLLIRHAKSEWGGPALPDHERPLNERGRRDAPRMGRWIAEQGLAPEEVMARVEWLLAEGAIRRIGAVPNHYALGYRANGMSVWDVPDEDISAIGRQVGALDFVSHAYHRPRHLPMWPYNLFAMVHGRTKAEVEDKVATIADLIGSADRGHSILYSTRILKKTGLRIVG